MIGANPFSLIAGAAEASKIKIHKHSQRNAHDDQHPRADQKDFPSPRHCYAAPLFAVEQRSTRKIVGP